MSNNNDGRVGIQIADLSLAELEELQQAIASRMDDLQNEYRAAPLVPTDARLRQERPTHFTYELEYVKCGKPNCWCAGREQGHGPYWYRYWRENGKLKRRYVGKTLPASIAS